MAQFFANRPLWFWVLIIGGLLVIAWGLFARAGLRASGGASEVSTAIVSGPSPDAALAASTAISQAQIMASADAKRADNELLMFTAEKAVEQTLGLRALESDERLAEFNYNLQTAGLATNERIAISELQARSDEFSMTAALEKVYAENDKAVTLADINARADLQKSLINANVRTSELAAENQQAATEASLFQTAINSGRRSLDLFLQKYRPRKTA